MIAEGMVKPSHAITPPSFPARSVPIAIPSWLLAGPGSNWHKATRSVNDLSSSHPRLATYSCRKYPMWATGPPNEVTPNRSATRNTLISFMDMPALEYF